MMSVDWAQDKGKVHLELTEKDHAPPELGAWSYRVEQPDVEVADDIQK